MPTTINASNTTGGAVVTGDGSGILELQSGGVTALTANGANVTVAGTLTTTSGLASPVTVAGNSTAGAEIRLPEDTDNGANYVALKAANSIASNVTFTLPAADGSSGQFLRTDGAGTLTFSSVSPGGTTGQVQYNNAGAFGAVASGTAGQVLTSGGAGVAPSFATPNFVPGAFGQFSVAGPSNISNVFYAASPADMLSAGGFAGAVFPAYNTTATNSITPLSTFYSSYYGCWFCAGYEQVSTLQYGVYSSKNGLNWSLALINFRGKAGAGSTEFIERIAVDDSNGALVVSTFDNSNLLIGLYVSAGTNWSSFTRSTIGFSGSGSTSDLFYIDTGTVGTSATVAIVNIDGVVSLRTCSGGATSWTTRIASGVGTSIIQYNRAAGMAFTTTSSSTVTYFTNNNAQTGWTNNTSAGVTFNQNAYAISNGVMVMSTATDSLAYSTTGSGSWTTVASYAGGNTVYSLIHNGSAWIALTSGGLYYNTSTLPTGAWTRAAASGAIRTTNYYMRQRYI